MQKQLLKQLLKSKYMPLLVNYKDVELRQREQIVLRDVNLQIAAGEFVYLLGRVGCGKSTLMKSLYGEVSVYSGEATCLGFDLRSIKPRQIPYLRRKMGIVFQDFQLLHDRTVEENLMFVLKATGWKDKKAVKTQVQDVLSQVGMGDKTYKMPFELSGGEQQRVAVARALLNSPDIILADEPTGNLDQETGRDIMDLLYGISKVGITVVMSTHNPSWPERYAGRRLLFADGKVGESK